MKSTDSLVAKHPLKDPDLDEVEIERCPNCWKLFPVHELPLHSPICQDGASKKSSKAISSFTSSPPSSREEPAAPSSDITARESPLTDALYADSGCLEQCPHCLELFPLEVLISHAETCSVTSASGSTRSSSGGRSISRTSVDSGDEAAALPTSILRDMSMEQCPYCSELLPVTELITHCAICAGKSAILPTRGTAATTEAMTDIERDSASAAKRARYTLEPFDRSAVSPLSSVDGTRWSLNGPTTGEGGKESASRTAAVAVMDREKPRSLGVDGVDELEQCVHCLKEFPISELVHHAASCSAAAKAEVQ